MSSEDAIIDLEIKIAFQEKWLAELDEVVRGLRDEIDALRSEVVRVSDQLAAGGSPGTPAPHDKPPHY